LGHRDLIALQHEPHLKKIELCNKEFATTAK
jgi:hypothetical protein